MSVEQHPDYIAGLADGQLTVDLDAPTAELKLRVDENRELARALTHDLWMVERREYVVGFLDGRRAAMSAQILNRKLFA